MEIEEKKDALSFEEAVEKLDEIVKRLAEPALSLEDAFRSYEEGMGLLKYCNAALDKVEKQVMLINDQGQETAFEQ